MLKNKFFNYFFIVMLLGSLAVVGCSDDDEDDRIQNTTTDAQLKAAEQKLAAEKAAHVAHDADAAKTALEHGATHTQAAATHTAGHKTADAAHTVQHNPVNDPVDNDPTVIAAKNELTSAEERLFDAEGALTAALGTADQPSIFSTQLEHNNALIDRRDAIQAVIAARQAFANN